MAKPDATATQDVPENSMVAVHGKHISVGDALSAHAAEQMRGLAAKYSGRAADAAVTFSRAQKGTGFVCHARMHTGRDAFFDGHGEHENAHGAFAIAYEHVAKQLRRRKRALREDKPANALKAGLVPMTEEASVAV